jgi:mRNA-degrading endonuclease HigB of HigAB toxin-antitoxin module
MKIIPNEALKRSLIRKYFRETRKVLVKVRQEIVAQAEHSSPEQLKSMIPYLLQRQAMSDHLVKIWEDVGSGFAFDTEKKITKGKEKSKADDEAKLADWKRKMRAYASERSLIKAQAILTTEQEAINRVIDSVIKETLDEGLGILESRKLLLHDLQGEEMLTMEKWQAQRIAMTEVGGAQNTASFEAAQENSEGVKKFWMFIPGLKTFREEHKGYEELGAVDMDYDFDTVDGGLQYPGDPDGTAEQVINCYCSIGYDTGN